VADFAKVGRLPRFHAQATIDPIACQRVLDALPAELTPFLQGFKVAGTFSTDLHTAIDLADLEAPVDLGGKVGIEGCKVTQAPDWGNADRLLRSFEQTVEYEPGKWMTFVVGPENQDFVPYAELSPHLVRAIISSEDFGFMRHKGFIPAEFRSALRQNLQRGYFRLGASSITMQMVKNVLLSREKTLSRKLQEMFLTWYLEHHLSKERILEIYFNVIEFGPGIYGIGRAARHYFGKSARDLTPREAAFFSSILPNPKRRYIQFCHASGQVDAKWDTYLKRILRKNHERKFMSDAEYEEAIAQPLSFSRAEAMSERDCMALVKRTTGGPPWPQAH
jgi:membrane peptidoglycan carboxypeptidase